jgi:UDP-N-acetylglucosamine 2-epimerase
LRSNDLYAPWPEEGNRRLIDSIPRLLWAPTFEDSHVGIGSDQEIKVAGKTIADALKLIIPSSQSCFNKEVSSPVLITLHR